MPALQVNSGTATKPPEGGLSAVIISPLPRLMMVSVCAGMRTAFGVRFNRSMIVTEFRPTSASLASARHPRATMALWRSLHPFSSQPNLDQPADGLKIIAKIRTIHDEDWPT
jgi:hypothetical protein